MDTALILLVSLNVLVTIYCISKYLTEIMCKIVHIDMDCFYTAIEIRHNPNLEGTPVVGKYTIAQELAKKYKFIICGNQLFNNSIFELLQYHGYTKIPEFALGSIVKIRGQDE